MKMLFFILALGCARLGAQTSAAPLRIVTFHTVLTEIARAVGGDAVSVTGVVQPGVDPHTFDPSAADVRRVADADLVLAAGLHLEGYLDRLAAQAKATGRVLALGDALPLPLGGEKDPHWWHSIDHMLFATDLVRRELSRLRPAQTAAFAERAQAYEERLFALKAWAVHEVSRLPASRRILVTSHDAFSYLAHDYGFTLQALNGVSTESEPDARHVARLVELIKSERIPAVFAETGVNPKLVEMLVRDTGVRLGGSLYADGLGPEGSDGATYEGMFRHNLSVIVEQLASP